MSNQENLTLAQLKAEALNQALATLASVVKLAFDRAGYTGHVIPESVIEFTGTYLSRVSSIIDRIK